MKINLKWQFAIASGLALLLGAAGASAQADSELTLRLQETSQTLTQTVTNGGRGGSVAFSTTVVGTGKTVTGAPYSAQVVTESVQPFADGNAITHTSKSSVWRDSQGRTRREQNINVIGPSQASGDALRFVTIDDPVAGVHYTLNPNKMMATQITTPGTMSGMGGEVLPRKIVPDGGGNVSIAYSSAGGGAGGESITILPSEISPTNVTTESLGADTMEGLSVLGTRVTRTIPAGQIGNAQPILIITDKWYSQDLQIEVKTVHSDPRTGTTTTTVTNLSRNEPNPSLFAVPPGYTISTGGSGANRVILKDKEPL